MIVMQNEDTTQDDRLFTPGEAVEYLRKKRGIVISVAALRARRLRGTNNASRVLNRTSLWTKQELDTIKPAPQTRQVVPED